MTSDRAYINRGIWNDADHRQLTLEAQHLYYLLLTHPTLSYAGVVCRASDLVAGPLCRS